MTGEFEWRQQYLSRVGNRDIFGDASAQDSVALNQRLWCCRCSAPVRRSSSTGGYRLSPQYPVAGLIIRQAWVGFAGPNVLWNRVDQIRSIMTAGDAYAGRPIIADCRCWSRCGNHPRWIFLDGVPTHIMVISA